MFEEMHQNDQELHADNTVLTTRQDQILQNQEIMKRFIENLNTDVTGDSAIE